MKKNQERFYQMQLLRSKNIHQTWKYKRFKSSPSNASKLTTKTEKVQEDVVEAWTKENPKKRKAEDKDDEESIPRLKQPRIDELPNLNTKQGTASR